MPFDLPPKLWLPPKPAIIRAASLDDAKVAMPLMGTFAAASVRGWKKTGAAEVQKTWNPSDKGADMALSNGNLDAAGATGGSWNMVRAISPVSGGKYYWELLGITASNAAYVICGIADSGASLTNYTGNSSKGGGFQSGNALNASHVYEGITSNSGSSITYGSTDVLMFAIDVANDKAWFGQNGSWFNSGDPAAGTGALWTGLGGGTWYPAASCYTTGEKVRLRSLVSEFSYSVPAGFQSYGMAA